MNQDTKFQFGSDDAIYRRDGGPPIPPDEPVILLRGKDQVTLFALREYVRIMRRFPGSQLAADHAESVEERIATIERWQRDHPARVGMGCHSCPDPTCREKLPLS